MVPAFPGRLDALPVDADVEDGALEFPDNAIIGYATGSNNRDKAGGIRHPDDPKPPEPPPPRARTGGLGKVGRAFASGWRISLEPVLHGEDEDQAHKEARNDQEPEFETGAVTDLADQPGDRTETGNAEAGKQDDQEGGVYPHPLGGRGEEGGPEAGGGDPGQPQKGVERNQALGQGNGQAHGGTEQRRTDHHGPQSDPAGQVSREETAPGHGPGENHHPDHLAR